MRQLHRYPLLAVIALLYAACGGDGKRITPPTQTSITLSTASATLIEGDSLRLTWTLSGFQTTPNVTLGSSDTDVATVAASGWVRAVAPGSARIIAQAGSAADTTELQVTQRPVALAFVNMPDTVAAGSGNAALQVRVTDARNDGVAGVQVRLVPLYAGGQESTVAAGNDGIANFAIAAPTEAGEYEFEARAVQPAGMAPDTAVLVVTAADAAVLAIGGDEQLDLQVGDTAQLTTSFTDAFGNAAPAQPITWVSSDEQVATVAAGLVEATGAGTASILAIAGVLRDSVRAVVTLPPPSNATIAPASASFTALLDTVQFSLTLTTPQGDTVTGQPVTWSVLNSSIASVDTQGRVVALAPGATRVIGTSAALSDTADITVAQVPASVVISPASVSLNAVGATAALSAAVTDANGQTIAGAAVAWSSLNAAVASVNASGVVTAQANGSASIVAVAGGAADTVSVTVQQVAASVEISPDGATLDAIGATTQLGAVVRDGGGQTIAGASVTWSSLDEAVATVSAAGLVTAESNGGAQIVATSGAVADTVSVTVQQVAASVEISPDGATLDAIGATTQLGAVVRDAGGQTLAGASVTWSSLDDAVATVSPTGLVTAASNGSAQIVATSGAAADTVSITVQQQVTALAVTPDAAALDAIAATTQLTAAATDANGQPVSGAAITWSSLDEAIATVNTSGLVTAVANGVAEIVATTGAFADTAVVTVAQVAASVAITVPADTMQLEGETQQLTAAYSDANGFAVAGIVTTWSSSADSIASVDPAGLVTAEAVNGTAWIRAQGGPVTDSVAVVVRDVAFVLYTSANSSAPVNIQVAMHGGATAPAAAYIYSETGELLARRTGPTINYTFPSGLDGTIKRVEIKANRAQVQAIEAAQDSLVGTFPEGILDLPNLAVLNLAYNPGLTGSLPAGLGTLTGLAALELFETGLSGALPANFGNLTNLDILDLSDTQLSGSVTMIENLTSLWYLNLSRTAFSGAMPEMGDMDALIEVYIAESGLNAYTGGLDELSTVTDVDFSDANLPAGDVDRILADLVTSVTAAPRGGTVNLGGTNAAPSPPGLTSVTTLQGLGWTVTVAP